MLAGAMQFASSYQQAALAVMRRMRKAALAYLRWVNVAGHDVSTGSLTGFEGG